MLKDVGLAYETERLTYRRVHADSLSGLGAARAEDAVYRRTASPTGPGPASKPLCADWTHLWSVGWAGRRHPTILLRLPQV